MTLRCLLLEVLDLCVPWTKGIDERFWQTTLALKYSHPTVCKCLFIFKLLEN